jgi:hypothetical protein
MHNLVDVCCVSAPCSRLVEAALWINLLLAVAMGRGGGWRQKVEGSEKARAEARGAADVKGSFLCMFLVGLWTWGLMSPQTLQKIAQRSLQDLQHAMANEDYAKRILSDLEAMAGIGSEGKYPSKCHQNLVHLLVPSQVQLFFTKLPLHLRGAMQSGPVMLYNQALLLPHELFSVMASITKLLLKG